MREHFFTPLAFILLTWAGACPASATVLDQKIDALYSEVSEKFKNDPWMKNSADTSLHGVFPPEYQMPDLDHFRIFMKSYCTLLQNPDAAKQVPSRDHYTFVDLGQDATLRRLYVYDIKNHQILHNMWASHGFNSSMNVELTLSNTSSGQKDGVLYDSNPSRASFFSNVPESNETSAGMTFTEPHTYWSTVMERNGLRMHGLDGELDSKIAERGIVLHGWAFTAQEIAYYHIFPTSDGCVMLPESGFYKGTPNAAIFDLIEPDLASSAVLLYHKRLDPKQNELSHELQLNTFSELDSMIPGKIKPFAELYHWSSEETAKYTEELRAKLKQGLLTRIEDTYQYFKNSSKFVGQPVASEEQCIQDLNL